MNISQENKKDKIKQLNLKCINCNRAGGTIFKNSDKEYIALCGNTKKPCNLNIRIQKRHVMHSTQLLEKYSNAKNVLQRELVLNSLNTLFQYTSEDVSIDNFERIQSSLSNISKDYESTLQTHEDLVNNPVTKERLSQLNTEKYDLSERMKELIKQYKEENVPELLQDEVRLNIHELMPLVIRSLKDKYRVNTVHEEADTGLKLLTQDHMSISDLEIILP